MATKNGIYRLKNSAGEYDEVHLKTSSGQVAETDDKLFVSSAEKTNWNSKANGTHNHTSLTGVTSIAFNAQQTDSASITTTVESANTYFDFNLSDDLGQDDQWRWRFNPSGGTLFSAMVLNPVSDGKADLTVSGELYSGTNKVYHVGNKPSLSDLGAAAASHTHTANQITDGYKIQYATLPANADLDTYYEAGFYTTGSDGNSQTIVNRPAGSQGFILKVHNVYGSGVNGRQIQTAYMRNTGDVYRRIKAENTAWTAWTLKGFSIGTSAGTAAAGNHTHDTTYLKLSGGSLTGNLNFTNDNTGVNFYDGGKIYKKSGDGLRIVSHIDSIGVKIMNRDESNTLLHVADSIFTYNGNNIYHTGNKPTLSELGAAPAAGSTSIATLAGDVIMGSNGAFSFRNEGGGWWQRIKTKDTTNKAVHRFTFDERQGAGEYVELFGVDGNGEIYAKGQKVYHEGNKPTASDISIATLSRGSYLTGNNYNGTTATTWSVDATSANTASKIVARDSSGNFSAGTITASLSGNASAATKLETARTIAISGGASGSATSFDGTGNISIPVSSIDASYLSGYLSKSRVYLHMHPEAGGAILPFLYNDLAFTTSRGGAMEAYITTSTDYTELSLAKDTTINLSSNVFDGSPSYSNYSVPSTSSVAVVDITTHTTFSWGTNIYYDGGAGSWAAKTVYIYAYHSSDPAGKYKLLGSTRTSSGQFSCYSSYSFTNDSGGTTQGFNRLRFVFTDFNSTSPRIACLGVINYGSGGLKETFVSKGGSEIYGNFTPYETNARYLGTQSKQWHSIHGKTLYEDGVSLGSKYLRANETSTLAAGKKIQFYNANNFIGTPNTDMNDLVISSCANTYIFADNDNSTTAEFVHIQAGKNILKVMSGGGITSDGITYNGNSMWHTGNLTFGSGANNMATGNHTHATLTRGSYLTGSNYNGGSAQTWAVDATSANTASKVVARDSSGNFSAGTITAELSGNATTASAATKLQTGRTINGTAFDGTKNITTISWGTARNITIGNATKSVSGGSDVSWTLTEIGASDSSHDHDSTYLKTTGGIMTGAITSSISSTTHLEGNKGKAIINSTAPGTSYNMLARMKSQNGVWTMGSWNNAFSLYYTVDSVITAGTNSYTKQLVLLNEGGNSSFPGTVTASAFSGNASSASKLETSRTIQLTGSVTGTVNTDLSGNVSIVTSTNHEHDKYVQGSTSKRSTDLDSTSDNGADNIRKSGFYRPNNTASTSNQFPDGAHPLIIHAEHPSANYGFQIAKPFANTDKVYFRARSNSDTWGDYYRIYHSGNKPTPTELGAADRTHTHVSNDINSLDASKLTGTIDISRLPHGALERCVVVANDTARFALTTSQVQTGDTVKVTSTGKMYFVVNDASLSTEAGYEVYTAGSATSVPWEGVTGKPTSMKNPYALTISLNGTSQGAYDGSAAKAFDITPASIGAATSDHTHSYAPSSHTHSSLSGSFLASVTPSMSTGLLRYDYNVSAGTAGVFPNSNNANGIITVNTHSGNYYSQLGFSSNGNVYHRNFNGVGLNTSLAWNQIAFTSSNVASASKLNSARTIRLSGAVTGSVSTDLSASEITITTVDEYKTTTLTKSLTLTTTWQDVGIAGADLETGSYVIQISGMSSSATELYNEIFTGMMSWYSGTTNSNNTDEIILHKAGHASNNRYIFLRTVRTGNPNSLKLQIASSTNFSVSDYTFKFRRLI